MPEAWKETINHLFSPTAYVLAGMVIFFLMFVFYRIWTKPAVALGLLGLLVLFFVLSWSDPNFNKIVTKPDNIPILGLIFLVLFYLWWSLRQAAINDERAEKGMIPLEAEESNDRVLVWPDLVYIEFISAVILAVVLVVWSVGVKAPLEEYANPARTPNPSKAPWYFLGLQEMLVYFDPWIAGVVLPTMIITGLIVIPYCDRNPKGAGYYTLKERPFAIGVFLFGFIILWVLLIIMGTFFRGPNWNFFGPYEEWNVHKVEPLTNINLSDFFWNHWLKQGLPTHPLIRELPGILLILGYFMVMPGLLAATLFKKMYKQMGFIRFSIMAIHLMIMFGMVAKMVLRWTINMKYIVFIPESFFNI